MITESYSASCYIENNDGQYHMECDMQTDNKQAYSKYDGTSFIDGMNILMDDLYNQMLTKSEPEPEELSLEDQVKKLSDMVNTLQDEKAELVNKINKLTSTKDNLKEPKEDSSNIDNVIKYLDDAFKAYFSNNCDRDESQSSLRWPFNYYSVK